jgi:hypothetical protein
MVNAQFIGGEGRGDNFAHSVYSPNSDVICIGGIGRGDYSAFTVYYNVKDLICHGGIGRGDISAHPYFFMMSFPGGPGRGDVAVINTPSIFSGGAGRGDYLVEKTGLILNDDIIYVSGSQGADGFYHSLTNVSGAFGAINATSQSGKTISVLVWGNSKTETGLNTLTSGTWNSITIYPQVTGLSISGDIALPTILVLDGAANVTFDGRLKASGSLKDMTFPKIKFLNTAVNNNIKYCGIVGDLFLTGASTVSVTGHVSVEGIVTTEAASSLSITPTGVLTVSGNITIIP